MIRQKFNIEHYWSVVIYYDVDYNLFSSIIKDFVYIGASYGVIKQCYYMLKYGHAKAATLSNVHKHKSVVLFNTHSSREDYLNSIVHEAEHIKQAMLDAYDVEDVGESPAYTIGYIISRMYPIIKDIICYKCY